MPEKYYSDGWPMPEESSAPNVASVRITNTSDPAFTEFDFYEFEPMPVTRSAELAYDADWDSST